MSFTASEKNTNTIYKLNNGDCTDSVASMNVSNLGKDGCISIYAFTHSFYLPVYKYHHDQITYIQMLVHLRSTFPEDNKTTKFELYTSIGLNAENACELLKNAVIDGWDSKHCTAFFDQHNSLIANVSNTSLYRDFQTGGNIVWVALDSKTQQSFHQWNFSDLRDSLNAYISKYLDGLK